MVNVKEQLKRFKDEIGKVIIGQDKVLDLIFVSLIQKGHILFESVPGTGKTMLSKSVAQALNGDFKRIQFTPDILPSDVTGLNIFNPKTREFELKKGPVDTNILLVDEINRATPRTQSSLLEVMEERQMTIDGTRIPMRAPFIVLATQNPIESKQGTFDLPEAQLDRFFMKIDLGYPSLEEELRMIDTHLNDDALSNVEAVLSLEEILEIQSRVNTINVDPAIQNYIVEIVDKTRTHPHLELGVSPRGSLALVRGAQGYAMIQGREYVTPEDVKEIAPYILTHRVVLSIEGMTLTTPGELIQEIMDSATVPVEFGVSGNEV